MSRRASWHVRANAPVVGWLLLVLATSFVHPLLAQPRWLLIHLLLLGAVTNAIVVWSAHFTEALLRSAPGPHARQAQALRLILLHDPGAFQHLPEGEGDLVLSGHTHGGQIGLVRLGVPHTLVSAFTKIPDHGLWARGRDRLYVHRGTGHYGFPLRVGVPAEHSLLQVHKAPSPSLEGAAG